MNWEKIKSVWRQMTDNVQETWCKLTDDELASVAGNREQLIGYLQESYGYEKERAEKELDEFTHGLKPCAVTTKSVLPVSAFHRIASS